LHKYEGVDLEDVKRDWAEVLGGFADHPEAIEYALKNLPDHKAPNAMEFAAVCRRAPAKEVPMLSHRLMPEDIQRNKERLQQIQDMLAARVARA
jgi:hypothetical protein